MIVKKWAVLVVCAAAAIALCAGLWAVREGQASASSPQTPAASGSAVLQSLSDPASTLFPDLSSMHVTALSISTPDRSFQFRLDTQGTVSVNGQRADREVFSTLLEQIAELPVDAHSAFVPEIQELLLTLVVSSGTQQQVARFYADGEEGEKARIVVGTPDAPEYCQTGGWRVGTLMMTCEGTRIQDAHGNETPIKH